MFRTFSTAFFILCLGLFSACSPTQNTPKLRGIDLSSVNYGQKINLPDASGKIRDWADFSGEVLVVFFGYTQCPDICPAALADIAHAREIMGKYGAKMRPIFVTLDPDRDTPEILAAYTAAFDENMIALRGNAEQTAAIIREFNLYANKVPGRDAQSYTLDHSAGLYLYDPQGKLRAYHAQNAGSHNIAHDALILLGASADHIKTP